MEPSSWPSSQRPLWSPATVFSASWIEPGTSSSEKAHLKARTIRPTHLLTSLRQRTDSTIRRRTASSFSGPKSRATVAPYTWRSGRTESRMSLATELQVPAVEGDDRLAGRLVKPAGREATGAP
ncbi:hypothetical protein AB1L88_02280 [Tautonia sp. JC769]|uniref:hypothetical protein n=1 Tax=Tautonia sp. JC769 TaxID=3232135 RepID=UPI0034580949